MGRFQGVLLAITVALVLLANAGVPQTNAEGESPYRITEFPIRIAPGKQANPVISGNWVVWNDNGADPWSKKLSIKNIETGQDYTITAEGNIYWQLAAGGNMIEALEQIPSPDPNIPYQGTRIIGFRLPGGERIEIAPFHRRDPSSYIYVREGRDWPDADGKTVAWFEEISGTAKLNAYDIASGRPLGIAASYGYGRSTRVSGNYIVWHDFGVGYNPRNPRPSTIEGFNLSTGKRFTLVTSSDYLGDPIAVSSDKVLYTVEAGNVTSLMVYDMTSSKETTVTQFSRNSQVQADMNGDLVVWSAKDELDQDIFGYDLKKQSQFVISRAVGDQTSPRVSGNVVLWVDSRNSGASSFEENTDIYGARLEPGPAPTSPAIGVPTAVDAKIEVVWPGPRTAAEANKANIGTWLFLADTLKPVSCQWNPKIQLWRAVNNEPAKPVAAGSKEGDHFRLDGVGVPTWDFNDIDVSAARDPNNIIYFFTTVEGVPSRTNVWAHGTSVQTNFPNQDTPTGISPIGKEVDARIEAAWPHDDAPVEQAQKVNVTSALFSPGTFQSVPPDWNPTVRLYQALNSEVGREVAIGQKRLVQEGSFTYPVWDFNDIDVSTANDPVNKYYFTLAVDGVTTFTNVWAHGADARTYFPIMDTPSQGCGVE